MNAITNTTPSVSTPSISSAAMLVELSIPTWTGRKLDKKASEDITATNYAAKGVANVSKKLLGDCAELDAVRKFAANARNTHYALTMPWSNSGLALLPTAAMFKYNEAMTELRTEFYRLVQVFLDAYQWEISQAQVKLGNMFNPDEYPSTEKLQHKFGFHINFMPVPEAGDWRVNIGNEARDLLTEQYKNYYTAQLNNAMNDVWRRAHTALTKMSERLDYADGQTKKVFRDSLVENVVDVIELMRVCNITEDSQMAALTTKLENSLRGVTPDALREDNYLRSETKRSVDEIIKSLPSLDL